MRDAERDRSDVVVLVVVWVLPLLAASALLAAAGLPLIGGALLAVEAVVGLCVLIATRRPPRPAHEARPWAVPLAMLGVLVGLLGLTLLVVRLG